MKTTFSILLALIVALALLPRLIANRLNRVEQKPPYDAPAWAKDLAHGAVDLHADPLLWGRDLMSKSGGQLDIPKLREIGAGLQVFGVVTHSPARMNVQSNRTGAFDTITSLAVISLWPARTWTSKKERALFEAQRFRDLAVRGAFTIVRGKADLKAEGLKGLLALEGSQALEGDLRNVDLFFDAGFRMMSPAHFVDTDIAGSAHGEAKGGLTTLGFQWLRKLEEKRIIVDLAHASPKAVDDVLAVAVRPVVVSHTGVKATCDSLRNLSDDQLRKLKANGALVGIGYWREATCGDPAKAIRHAADVMGVEHVALGSDFDGAVVEPWDVTGLPLLAVALREQHFTDDEIRAVFSRSALRFLSDTLP